MRRAGTAKVLPGGAACVGRIGAGAFDVADAFGVDTRGAWGASRLFFSYSNRVSQNSIWQMLPKFGGLVLGCTEAGFRGK